MGEPVCSIVELPFFVIPHATVTIVGYSLAIGVIVRSAVGAVVGTVAAWPLTLIVLSTDATTRRPDSAAVASKTIVCATSAAATGAAAQPAPAMIEILAGLNIATSCFLHGLSAAYGTSISSKYNISKT
jgi:hypothetical protein